MHIYYRPKYATQFEMSRKERIKMKKLLLLSSVAAALSANVQAQTKDSEKWVAGFVEFYSTDQSETGLPDFLDNGVGFGAEMGFKFTPEWAARLEVSHLNIDASPSDESGNRIGADVLYFMPEDIFYAFGGLKHTKITDGDLMANIGLGKHWDLGNNMKVITEVAAYQNVDSGESGTHIGYKLGLAYAFGGSSSPAMPKDSDNDGVTDSIDQCANTPIGTRVDNVGCALDSDGDGVLNDVDMCPDTPAGRKVGAKGCSLILDTDQDGILDEQDQCADTPMTDKVDENGCSVFTEQQISTNIKVLFGSNSSVINNPDDAQFHEFADFMNRYPATDTLIEGHASAPGNADYNMMMSQRRADAVKTLLVNKYGIDSVRLTTKGFGETQLLDTSNTLAANKANRRITAKVSVSKRIKVER
jgi:OOP family OmpA-OmpF porin